MAENTVGLVVHLAFDDAKDAQALEELMARARTKAVAIVPRTDTGIIDGRFPDGVPSGGPPDITPSQSVPTQSNLEAGTAYSLDVRTLFSGAGLSGSTYTVQQVSGTLAAVGLTFDGTHTISGTGVAGQVTITVTATKSGFTFVTNAFLLGWVTVTPPDAVAPSIPVAVGATVNSPTSVTVSGPWGADILLAGSQAAGMGSVRIERSTDGGAYAFLASVNAPSTGTAHRFDEYSIGSPSGTTSVDSVGDITIGSVTGDTIGSTTDVGKWRASVVSGNFRATAKLIQPSGITAWAFPMLMARALNTQTSQFIGVRLTQSQGMSAIWRATAGGTLTGAGDVPMTGDVEVMIDRTGNLFSVYRFDTAAQAWSLMTQQTIAMTDPIFVGLYGCRASTGASANLVGRRVIINKMSPYDWTHTDTTVTGGHQYRYRAYFRDAQNPTPNDSGYSDVAMATTDAPPASAAIKLHQGHYVSGLGGYRMDTTQLAQLQSFVNSTGSNPNIRGYAKFTGLGYITQTQGNIGPGITRINQMLDMFEPYGKRLMLFLYAASYGSPYVGVDNEYYPTYYNNNGWVTYAPLGSSWAGATRDHAQFWKVPVADDIIENILIPLGEEFNGDPRFEMLLFGESSGGVPEGTDGFSNVGLNTQLRRILTESKPSWPNTVLTTHTAWTNTDTMMANQFQDMENYGGAAAGGTDPELPWPNPTLQPTGPRVYRTQNNWKNRIPYKAEVQWIGLGQTGYPQSTPSAIASYFRTELQAPWMVWSHNETVGTSAQKWSTGVLPYINANPNMYTSIPWAGNWNTN